MRKVSEEYLKTHNLALSRPDLAREWNYKGNFPLTPYQVGPYSRRKVKWICKNGHRFQARVFNRFQGAGCRYCAKKVVTPEYNLKVIYSDIAKDWDYKRNYPLRPEKVMPHSRVVVYWDCEFGHKKRASVGNRVNGNGCAACKKIVASKDHNLAKYSPFLVNEWDYDKNYPLTPYDVAPFSDKKVAWKCYGKKHEWVATISDRSRGSKCPQCTPHSRNKIITIEDIQILAKKKGGECLSEKYVSRNSKLQWKCKEGHIWETSLTYVKSGSWCRICRCKERDRRLKQIFNESKYKTLREAKNAVKKLKIKTSSEYYIRYNKDKRLPSAPDSFYPEWVSWTNLLGKSSKYINIADAQDAVKRLKIKSAKEYAKRYKEDPHLPAVPWECYKNDWVNWVRFFEKVPSVGRGNTPRRK